MSGARVSYKLSTLLLSVVQKRRRTLKCDFLEGSARCTGGERLPSISSKAKEHGCQATFSCNVKAHDDGHTKLLSMGQVAADIHHPFRFGKLIVGVDQYEGTSTTQLSSQSLLNQSGPVTTSVSSFSQSGMQTTQLTQDRGFDPHISANLQGGVEISGVKLAYERTFERAVVVGSNEPVSCLYLDTSQATGFAGTPTNFCLEDRSHEHCHQQRTHLTPPDDYIWFKGVQESDQSTRYEIHFALEVVKGSKHPHRIELGRVDLLAT